ncbi:DNA translocase FtsK [Brevibacillus dissolubilis]|uniref:DNA translocase FtsK n=1 Tax=Brevibacillus dissolubilis TaxID=1844116 RepID=UPI0020FFFEDC|nr:DNA translocase FtsK [Brevibacillus dissolubilis]
MKQLQNWMQDSENELHKASPPAVLRANSTKSNAKARTKSIYPREREGNGEESARPRQFRFPVIPDGQREPGATKAQQRRESAESLHIDQQEPKARKDSLIGSARMERVQRTEQQPPRAEQSTAYTETVKQPKRSVEATFLQPEMVREPIGNAEEMPTAQAPIQERPRIVPNRAPRQVHQQSAVDKRSFTPTEIISPIYGKIKLAEHEKSIGAVLHTQRKEPVNLEQVEETGHEELVSQTVVVNESGKEKDGNKEAVPFPVSILQPKASVHEAGDEIVQAQREVAAAGVGAAEAVETVGVMATVEPSGVPVGLDVPDTSDSPTIPDFHTSVVVSSEPGYMSQVIDMNEEHPILVDHGGSSVVETEAVVVTELREGTELQAGTELPLETEVQASTGLPPETELPAETELQPSTELPAETEQQAVTELPAETEQQAVTELQTKTEPVGSESWNRISSEQDAEAPAMEVTAAPEQTAAMESVPMLDEIPTLDQIPMLDQIPTLDQIPMLDQVTTQESKVIMEASETSLSNDFTDFVESPEDHVQVGTVEMEPSETAETMETPVNEETLKTPAFLEATESMHASVAVLLERALEADTSSDRNGMESTQNDSGQHESTKAQVATDTSEPTAMVATPVQQSVIRPVPFTIIPVAADPVLNQPVVGTSVSVELESQEQCQQQPEEQTQARLYTESGTLENAVENVQEAASHQAISQQNESQTHLLHRVEEGALPSPQAAATPIVPSAPTEPPAEEPRVQPPYNPPNLTLLTPSPEVNEDDYEYTLEQKRLLEETLSNFNVNAQVVGIVKGPTVTRFELQPAPGVKVNKITSLSDDIKLNMAAKDIRIEAPIPGRNAVGIEVPNIKSEPIFISRILGSEKFQEHPSPLAIALGMDIGGEPIVADIKKMPHGLIAGSTGSGKSVCINSIIVSLLYKASPEQVRLLLIDPKMVELAPYNHLPHLVTPVVTEAKHATAALKWAVEEMEKRYALFVDAGVRDIDRYNQTTDDTLPFIVIIIDELADLMMVAPQDVEDCIIRIAQKARACGIHLLLATQRPSVDVITGNIKANVPTRLAFAVFSTIDSRTILDQSGAERLLGRGDMLFLESGTAPVRLQGNYVSDEEIEAVTQMIKKQRKPEYIFSKEELESKADSYDAGEDALFYEALTYVAEQGQASTSGLQRRFRIGYNRAARLIEMMEAGGYITGHNGGKPRSTLITHEDAVALSEGSN